MRKRAFFAPNPRSDARYAFTQFAIQKRDECLLGVGVCPLFFGGRQSPLPATRLARKLLIQKLNRRHFEKFLRSQKRNRKLRKGAEAETRVTHFEHSNVKTKSVAFSSGRNNIRPEAVSYAAPPASTE